ncbi:hypothetical protein [Candidatus Ichthyocystis hellenicum]|uniref:hypothetical protein n=1 Tax=Candidatus Ichthyocystis hellenicum TaxID=1561003 RepID=UPI000B8977BD|nr:hypothetical protein [Candidatus Ichthyocystis hellenicum]
MVASVVESLNCVDSAEVESQNQVLENHSNEEDSYIQELTGGQSCRGSLGQFRSFVAPLIFLGTLKCGGSLPSLSIGWRELKSNLCSLILVKEYFDAAISRGEDVPSINITSILHHFLNKAGIPTNHVDNETFPLHNMNVEEEASEFFYISDGLADIFRGLVFNQTGIATNQTTGNLVSQLIDDYDHRYKLRQVEFPHLKDVVNYTYSDYATRSNISREAITHVLHSRWNVGSLRYKIHCPNITEYMPVGKYIEDLIKDKFPTEAPEAEPSKSTLAIATAALMFVGVLSIFFYAIYNLVKPKCYKLNNNIRNSISRTICIRSDDEHYIHLSEITAEEE